VESGNNAMLVSGGLLPVGLSIKSSPHESRSKKENNIVDLSKTFFIYLNT
jgi:hypothetical protein